MPALPKPKTGNQTTVSGLGQTAAIRKIHGLTEVLGSLETSWIATELHKTVLQHDLVEPPKVFIECYAINVKIYVGQQGTFTITWPQSGEFAGTGFISEVRYPDAENGVVMMCGYEVTFDGYEGPGFIAYE